MGYTEGRTSRKDGVSCLCGSRRVYHQYRQLSDNLADKYAHLEITIILVVPKHFKEAKEVLQIACNGIRYDAVPLPTTNPTIDDESALNLGLLWRHHNPRSAARGRGVRGRVRRAAWCQRDL
jgi:hypothetical protein